MTVLRPCSPYVYIGGALKGLIELLWKICSRQKKREHLFIVLTAKSRSSPSSNKRYNGSMCTSYLLFFCRRADKIYHHLVQQRDDGLLVFKGLVSSYVLVMLH